MRKLYLPVIMILAFGCNHPNENAIQIALINNSTLKITGIDSLVLNDIARDTANRFDVLASIYRMPADTEMKDYQPVQPGKYTVKNGELIFVPDTAFIKGQTYFVRYYRFSKENSVWDFMSKRKNAMSQKYNDLIFKP